MILYLETDPEMINHNGLDERLNSELKTIKPTVMNSNDSFK